jgi:hypothetical protein
MLIGRTDKHNLRKGYVHSGLYLKAQGLELPADEEQVGLSAAAIDSLRGPSRIRVVVSTQK